MGNTQSGVFYRETASYMVYKSIQKKTTLKQCNANRTDMHANKAETKQETGNAGVDVRPSQVMKTTKGIQPGTRRES